MSSQTEQNQTYSPTDGAALEAAQALTRKVVESDVYKEFEAATMAFRGDAEVQKLFRMYQSMQRDAQKNLSWSGTNKAFESHFQGLEKKLLAHSTYARFMAAQENLLVVLNDLNDYLTGKLGFDFADMTKPAAGGCC